MSLLTAIQDAVRVGGHASPDWDRATKKNYTERLSKLVTDGVTAELQRLGLKGAKAPVGRDKQFMGGYGSKGVDSYLSDEKHGLMLSSGTKGIVFDGRRNLKNRYRDMAMEALELHKRFPYAVCGHLLFLDRDDAAKQSRAFGTLMGEAVVLMSGITGRVRPDEPAEIYEAMGVLTFKPGEPSSVSLAPADVPPLLVAETYCDRLVESFLRRNPLLFIEPEADPSAPLSPAPPVDGALSTPRPRRNKP